ncbi:MAG TPA: 2-succinyl-5-enolpyruvyl-6-hydroxy-3-cyclohexene-1-carboxylic-acid synthase [Ilumatobacter sp.]|nr:2-succinyl-5-enolpyruvyl-6-hydroxy-3-cyclohexene-1-carboxylic-acid synthase [Ilumatobacter sp.]
MTPASDPAVIAAANATFAATLIDEWVRCGVRHAVVAPGSRSTPLAVALAERTELRLHVVHDERVAAFTALGIGLASGTPAVLVCTSGTAAANFHPAVVEAGLSDVPMLVCTADRPPELRGIGAPQTIDQVDLYVRAVRWSHDAPPPDNAEPAQWRPLAQRAFTAAEHGPVHLNLPFREPLVGAAGPLPEPIGPPLPVPRVAASNGLLDLRFNLPRGVIVAGGRSGVSASDVSTLAARLGWPILADPHSGLRGDPLAVTAFDSLLRNPTFAGDQAPDLVVRVGRPAASKLLTQWIVASGAPVVQVGGPGVVDPDHNVAAWCVPADLASLTGCPDGPWLGTWLAANVAAERAFDELTRAGRLPTDPAVARTVAAALPDDAELVVAASMPMRDLEWFGGAPARALANRGANGIDGVLSTALGVALTGRPVVALLGDIAYLHDSNALLAAAQLGADLRVVVVDNAGGGIFSFLPQATELAADRFEQLFGTPHTTDLCALARAHGIPADTAATLDEVAVAVNAPGPRVTRVASDRAGNIGHHAEWHARAAP